MYEMYPDAWTNAEERRQTTTTSDQPRRRARREHSVNPPVIDRVIARDSVAA